MVVPSLVMTTMTPTEPSLTWWRCHCILAHTSAFIKSPICLPSHHHHHPPQPQLIPILAKSNTSLDDLLSASHLILKTTMLVFWRAIFRLFQCRQALYSSNIWETKKMAYRPLHSHYTTHTSYRTHLMAIFVRIFTFTWITLDTNQQQQKMDKKYILHK